MHFTPILLHSLQILPSIRALSPPGIGLSQNFVTMQTCTGKYWSKLKGNFVDPTRSISSSEKKNKNGLHYSGQRYVYISEVAIMRINLISVKAYHYQDFQGMLPLSFFKQKKTANRNPGTEDIMISLSLSIA